MSKSSGVKTIVVPWRKFCAALPAIALIGAGVAFAPPIAPTRDIVGVAVSSDSTAIVVPDTAMTMPAVRSPEWTDPLSMAAPEAPGLAPSLSSAPVLVSPEGTTGGGSGSVALDGNGIPVRALEAYHAAALVVDAADPGCHIDWALLAAFGRVESNHARFGGNQLDPSGVAQPGIIGLPLDGTNGTARILDSDGGRLDRDAVYDRAVGPMQFIPSTWRVMGVDADGDGVKNPQDMADAASATAVYVCSGPGDLNRPGDLHGAIMRYNASEAYTSMVTALAATYRLGVSAIPAQDLPTANSAPSPFIVSTSAPSPFIVSTSAPSPFIVATSTPPTFFVTTAAPIHPTLTPAGLTPTAQTPTGLNPAAPEPAGAAPAPAGAAPAPAAAAPAPVAAAPAPAAAAGPEPAPVPAAPVTTPPVTKPPVTTPPVTTPPVTTPPVTTPPVTTPPATCLPQPTPTDPVPTVLTTPGPCPPDPCLPVPTPTPTPTPTPGTCAIVPTAPTTP